MCSYQFLWMRFMHHKHCPYSPKYYRSTLLEASMYKQPLAAYQQLELSWLFLTEM